MGFAAINLSLCLYMFIAVLVSIYPLNLQFFLHFTDVTFTRYTAGKTSSMDFEAARGSFKSDNS